MFSSLNRSESDHGSNQTAFEGSQTPPSSSYLDHPLRKNTSSHHTSLTDSSQNARKKDKGRQSDSSWSYSRLHTSEADKSDPMNLHELERNDNSSSELDTSFPPKPTSELNAPSYDTIDDEMTTSKSPSSSIFRRLSQCKSLKQHPVSQRYEVPEWMPLALHILLCIISYPVLLVAAKIADGRTLFWTRFIVGIGTGSAGVSLGYTLLQLSRRHLEATVWATVMHQSQSQDHPGVQLKDIARHVEDPASAYNGIMLFWDRYHYAGTARKNRAYYDTRPWSMHPLFFLVAFMLSGILPFIFGRVVKIHTRRQIQGNRFKYNEVAINGDISVTDNDRASDLLGSVFNPENQRLTWTLLSYSTHIGPPPVFNFSWTDPFNTNHSDVVYFSQPTRSQLQNRGHGLGTFETETNVPETPVATPTSMASLSAEINAEIVPGSIARLPRWGTRIKCEKIPDTNILPKSQLGLTYVFVPQDAVAGLLDYYGKPLPAPGSFPTPELQQGDQGWPANVKQNDTLIAVPISPSGDTLGYSSNLLYNEGSDGTGFVSLELGLVRLNTSFAPHGHFSILGEAIPDVNGTTTHIGYDATVCIQLFEPWIIDVYNSSVGAPTPRNIVEKGSVVRNIEKGKEKMIGKTISDPNIRRNLTSQRMREAYKVAHQNSINQLVKDAGGAHMDYGPSTTVIECTNGTSHLGYTSMSAPLFGRLKARADAANLLPYMVGSGAIVVRSYSDRVVAFASLERIPLIVVLISFFALGALAAFLVPKLPKGMPRRGFDLYSWLAAFYADELIMADKLEGSGGQSRLPIRQKMEIEDMEQRMGKVRFRCVS